MKILLEKELEVVNLEEDIYEEFYLESQLEDDAISPEEEGFMIGYIENEY